eukprot:1178507-Prorocentrum_minimum.AAC.10
MGVSSGATSGKPTMRYRRCLNTCQRYIPTPLLRLVLALGINWKIASVPVSLNSAHTNSPAY